MGGEEKETFVHLDHAHKRDDLPEYDQTMRCPKCQGETRTGFGLAGGGFGIYSYCESCGNLVSKSETPE